MNTEFEASIKSGILADPERIKKKDEIIVPILKGTRRFLIAGIIFTAAAIGVGIYSFYQVDGRISYRIFIAPVILLLVGVFCLWAFGRRKMTDDELREFYEEGLLVGGMITNTQPLTLMALSSLVAYDGPDRYGCYKMVMRELEGARGTLYEKIPCSCFFRYEKGNYHDAFQPHPLYWGTTDYSGISQALQKVEAESMEEGEDTWGIIKQVAEQFPDLKDGQLVILDENYEPIGIRYYWQTGLDPIPKSGDEKEQSILQEQADGTEEKQQREYVKKPQTAELNLRFDKPGRDVYERFAALACRHLTYDYISRHCKYGSISNCSHPGFFTYIGDPVEFPREVKECKVSLQSGEYPLFKGNFLATNRGLYRKKEFIPWREAEVTFKIDFLDNIKVYVNGKYCTEFEPNLKGYEGGEEIPEEDKKLIAGMEIQRLEAFFREIKQNGV